MISDPNSIHFIHFIGLRKGASKFSLRMPGGATSCHAVRVGVAPLGLKTCIWDFDLGSMNGFEYKYAIQAFRISYS